jgi:hypothetical protein
MRKVLRTEDMDTKTDQERVKAVNNTNGQKKNLDKCNPTIRCFSFSNPAM